MRSWRCCTANTPVRCARTRGAGSARDEADDVVADVFVVAWRRIGDVPAEPRTWLLGIARRVLANRHRSAKRQRALYERLAQRGRDGARRRRAGRERS